MLNTEERVEVAKNVIELASIEDEDLKQEIYLNALEFKNNTNCVCGKIKCIQCLSDYLMEIARTYTEKSEEYEKHERAESVVLDHFDYLILASLLGLR